MSLTTGTRLGPYEIISPIGAGGMGEVYKAQDARLDRTVAIKVLPSHLADNPDLKQRFEREARAVSSLNHPNICTLHDIHLRQGYGGQVGDEEEIDYMVMEYVEGEDLADRLKKGPLPLDEALRYAAQIADALDKAHRAGVVHRDLKPGNIMITKSGAKLLDFGLAKLRGSAEEGPDISALPTEQKPLTEKGSILGTFQYMSPEQLEGKEADTRSDIFAFGAVLYEMVTGKRAFTGKSQASLIGSIMEHNPPPVSSLQPITPPILDLTVTLCLKKDPQERWQSAYDLLQGLKWVHEAEPASQARPAAVWGKMLPFVVGAFAAGALIASLVFWNSGSTPELATTRFQLAVYPGEHLSGGHPLERAPFAAGRPSRKAMAFSPDGRRLVYVATAGEKTELYLHAMDRQQATPIPGTTGASSPFFSPDGQSIGFFVGDQLKRIPTEGGNTRTIGTAPSLDLNHGASWTAEDTILLAGGDGLFEISASGGTAQRLTTVDREQDELIHLYPQSLLGGKAVLFNLWRTDRVQSDADIIVQHLETGERRVLIEGGADPR